MFKIIANELRPVLVSIVTFTFICGVFYPVAVTLVAQVLFPAKANGGMIVKDGKPTGSELIGQQFTDAKYFWGRLSATSKPYDASASSGSNLGPLNSTLADNAKARIKDLQDADPENKAEIPVDLVTSSGSGLDPHISPEAAEYQVHRIAKARGMDEGTVRQIVAASTEDRTFGVLGEPRVNVLKVNLALDEAAKR